MDTGYQLPEELKMLQTWMRNFVQKEILPLEQKMDPEAVKLSKEDHDRLTKMARDAGMWFLSCPEKYGGGGLGSFAMSVIYEELSQHRNGLYNPGYSTLGYELPHIIFEGAKEQIEKWAVPSIQNGWRAFFAVTEPSGGSDPARAIKTTAVRDGKDWVINGTKCFSSGAGEAEWGMVFARTNPEVERAGITCFIVDKAIPGLTITPIPVIRPWYPFELSFEGYRVPDANRLGEVDQGFAMVNRLLVRNRFPYSAENLGVAVAAQRMAIEYAKQRVVFRETLSRKQGIQWMLADSDVEIRATRWLIWDGAWKADRGEEHRHEASVAKLYSSEMLGRVVDRAVQIHGGYGICKELPLERWYRESRIRRIGEGPSEVHRLIISRDILRS